MENVVLVIHLFLALAIIGLVLLQRSEGGGLGIGGGGGMGGIASPRGTANFLTRATAIFAAGFFCTSLMLGVLAGQHSQSRSILEVIEDQPAAVSETLDEANEEGLPSAPIIPNFGNEDTSSDEPSDELPAAPIAN